MSKGNKQSCFTTLGARNYALEAREENDYYATDPRDVEMLLELETFDHNIWEPACGEGHISKVLLSRGYNVKSTDLIDRGYGQGGVDFLTQFVPWDGDIITNPPYTYGLEFVRQSLNLIGDGHKAAFFLKVQFLEGKARRELYNTAPPPKNLYIIEQTAVCA